METLDINIIDSDIPLYDVIIRLPPGVQLETIQKLAETQAGLPPDRVERLIKVLQSTPNAKVGAAVTLERAERERARFAKAGLDTEIVPLKPQVFLRGNDAMRVAQDSADSQVDQLVETSRKIFDDSATQGLTNAHPDPVQRGSKSMTFRTKSGLAIGAALALGLSLFYAGNQGVTINGVSVPWGTKDSASITASGPNSPQTPFALPIVVDPAGDPYVDDPLILAASGKRTSPSGLTIEQAVVEATGLAGAAEAVSQQTRHLLTAEFAIVLAELGQDTRAKEVLKAFASDITPTTDQRVASRLPIAQMELQAWAILKMDATQSKQGTQELRTKTQTIANAQERTLLQAKVADILSRNMHLSPEVPRAFLALAAESLKSVGDPQSKAAQGNLTVSTAKVYLRETTNRAKSGLWSRAKVSAAQVEDLVKQAPDGWTQARLYAVDYQAKLQIGQNDKAAKSLASALELAGKTGNLHERAIWLRKIAKLSDAGTQEQFETAANTLLNQVNMKSGFEKAQVLTELSLLYFESSLPGKASLLRSQAQATAGLTAAESTLIHVDLIARGDMALAKMLHGQGRYAEAETVLQRIGSYLL